MPAWLVAGLAVVCMSFVSSSVRASGFLDDPLGTQNDLSVATAQLGNSGWSDQACNYVAPKDSLTLLDAVIRALCYNPRTHQAWAQVEAQAAAVGIGKSAYLPNVSINAGVSSINALDKFKDTPQFNSAIHGSSNEETITLHWVLYDFGLRAANLRYERALLKAVSASQDDALQSIVIDTARAYFTAQQDQAVIGTDIENEQAAKQSVDFVQANIDAGITSQAALLEAKTALARMRLRRIQHSQELMSALGVLAVMIGLPPDATLRLRKPDDTVLGDSQFDTLATQLVDRALQENPKVLAAKARLDAARNEVFAAKADGLPSLSFVAAGDRSDTPINRVSTRQTIETSSVGLQLTIPLFEGFSHTYRIHQAQARVESSEADLAAVQQQVVQDVWRHYVAYRGNSKQLTATAELLDSANQSYKLAFGRYKSGVGSITDLLRVQSDLADAREQSVLIRARGWLAKLQLAASLGQIDFSSLQAQMPREPLESTSAATPPEISKDSEAP